MTVAVFLLAVLLSQVGEFAFVVFQAAAGARVFPAATASLLIGAVALSMLLTPLLLVGVDKVLMPRYAGTRKPALAELSEPQAASTAMRAHEARPSTSGRCPTRRRLRTSTPAPRPTSG